MRQGGQHHWVSNFTKRDHFIAKWNIFASTLMHTCINFIFFLIKTAAYLIYCFIAVMFYQKTWSWTSPLVFVCGLSQCLGEVLHGESFLVSQTETETKQGQK